MPDAVRAFVEEHQALLGWLAAGSAVMLFVSLVTLPVVAVLLPADFLMRMAPSRAAPTDDAPRRPPLSAERPRRHPALRWTLRVLKNVIGVLLVVAGLAMLVLPGQGLITLALALLLLDLPGKRRLQHRILRSPRLLRPLNRIRRRFGRAPILPG